MLLLIVLHLSAQVFCTVRDTSLNRLIDEGFGVAHEVMARDSRGVDRVVSQFRGPRGAMIDVIPSWLVGGEEGTSVQIRLGARVDGIEVDDVDRGLDGRTAHEYEIQGMEDWIIRYEWNSVAATDLQDMAANELLFRSRHTLPVNILYFSRPDPETPWSWCYTIVDHRPRRLLFGIPQWAAEMRLPSPLRKISSVIEAVIDWALLLRRYPHINDSARLIFGRSQINHSPDDPELTFVMVMPLGFHSVRDFVRDDDLTENLELVAGFIHHNERLDKFAFRDAEEFVRHAFFIDSDSPGPIYADPTFYHFHNEYTFKTLQEVLGDEFEGYDIDEVRSKFREFVELIRHEWNQRVPNHAAIPSLVSRVEDIDYFILK